MCHSHSQHLISTLFKVPRIPEAENVIIERFPLYSPLADSPNVNMSHGGSFNLTFCNIPNDNDTPN